MITIWSNSALFSQNFLKLNESKKIVHHLDNLSERNVCEVQTLHLANISFRVYCLWIVEQIFLTVTEFEGLESADEGPGPVLFRQSGKNRIGRAAPVIHLASML